MSEARACPPTTFERPSLACRKQSGASSIGSTDVPGIDGQPKEYTVEVHVDILLELFLIGKKSVVGKSVVEREVRLFSEELGFLGCPLTVSLQRLGRRTRINTLTIDPATLENHQIKGSRVLQIRRQDDRLIARLARQSQSQGHAPPRMVQSAPAPHTGCPPLSRRHLANRPKD